MSKNSERGWGKLWASLYAYWGPHSAGTYNWLLFTMFVLLTIVLLGGFLYVPLAAAFTAVATGAFFYTLILTLKVAAFIGFALGLTMGITAMVNDYYARENGNRDYFWLPYLQDLWRENFVLSDKRTVNLMKLAAGLLVFALVVALLVCTSGIGLTIPVITVVVNFTATAFATTSIFAGASGFTALFLGVLAMTAYGVLFHAIESFLAGDTSHTSKHNLGEQVVPKVSSLPRAACEHGKMPPVRSTHFFSSPINQTFLTPASLPPTCDLSSTADPKQFLLSRQKRQVHSSHTLQPCPETFVQPDNRAQSKSFQYSRRPSAEY